MESQPQNPELGIILKTFTHSNKTGFECSKNHLIEMYLLRTCNLFRQGIGIGLTADPGVVSLILALSHTFAEIDHKIISTAILLSSPDSRTVVVSYK